jgi:Aminotransferase class I and II
MRIENLLTAEQREGQQHALIDLSIGYPVRPPSKEVDDHLELWAAQAISRRSSTSPLVAMGSDRYQVLKDAISQLLRISPVRSGNIEVTFSGSIALQRAIVATQELALAEAKEGVFFFVLEPCVDFYRSMLDEPQIPYALIDRYSISTDEWLAVLRGEIRAHSREHPNHLISVILDSPSNPMGVLLDDDELESIADVVGEVSGVLIADHCFALAGIHDHRISHFVYTKDELPCDWIAIWDTGKTFDLNGDKIGVLISSSPRVKRHVDQVLETIQVVPSIRTASFFSQFLSHPLAEDLVLELQQSTRQNLQVLLDAEIGVEIPVPQGGTFAILVADSNQSSSTDIRQRLLQRGLSVSSGASFRARHEERPPFIRLSLARPDSVFREAVSRLSPFPA